MTKIVERKIKVIWTELNSGESLMERRIVQIIAAILSMGLAAAVYWYFWR